MKYSALFLAIMSWLSISSTLSDRSTQIQYNDTHSEMVSLHTTDKSSDKEHTETMGGHIRYSIALHDSSGQTYTVRIYSENESMYVEQNDWSGASEGDRIYRGKYRINLVKAGQEQLEGQPLMLFDDEEMEFHSSRNMVYKVESGYPGQPDLLVVTQHGGSNGVFARFFYIRDEELRPVAIKWQERTNFELFMQEIENPAYMVFQTKAYVNAEGNWYTRRWTLDIKTDSFLLIDTKVKTNG
ncbi:hypothetical protein ACI7RC_13095 [Brevibacillus sp. B_LB10_24]|uniref:hypothetical protein n=1 Tax=Brevibacillus sp. B_LB10_24 TaxID=3380645 RepID=UPI0038BB5A91